MRPIHALPTRAPSRPAPIRVNLRDPMCLIAIRKKWDKALRRAQELDYSHCDCYPASIGATTQHYVHPNTGPINARQARCLAQGSPFHTLAQWEEAGLFLPTNRDY